VLVPEGEAPAGDGGELTLLATGEEPLPEPVRLSGQLLVIGLAGFLALLGFGALFGAIYIRQDPVQEAPLPFALAVFGFGVLCISAAGLILWLLVAPARRARRG
jgi:hypothetical protein